MKRIIAIIISAALLFVVSGCADSAKPEATEPVPATPEPTPTASPEPEWEEAKAKIDGAGVIWTLLQRDTAVKVTGEEGEFYVLDMDGVEVFVEKRFVRLNTEEASEPWTGYAKGDGQLFRTVYLEGEVLKTLSTNDELTVLDSFGDLHYVEIDGLRAYIKADELSSSRIVYNYGGGGGGNSGGGGQDGGDIALGYRVQSKPDIALLSAAQNGERVMLDAEGIVLGDGVEAYLRIYKRGDSLKLTEAGEEQCYILVDESIGQIPRWMIYTTGEAEYAQWTGYSKSGAELYAGYRMQSKAQSLDTNTELAVLAEVGESYYVQLTDETGTTGFVLKEDVSDTKVVYYYGGGGGSGGGAQWSEPVL